MSLCLCVCMYVFVNFDIRLFVFMPVCPCVFMSFCGVGLFGSVLVSDMNSQPLIFRVVAHSCRMTLDSASLSVALLCVLTVFLGVPRVWEKIAEQMQLASAHRSE
eukprot:Opistho-2@45599